MGGLSVSWADYEFMRASKAFVFRFDDVVVREQEFSLTKAGKVLTVEPKAFRVLLFLLRNPQKLISKGELLNAVWRDIAVSEGSLTRCIWLLRNLLGDDIRNPRYIETVATVGYRFVCSLEVLEETPGDLPSTDSANPGDGPAGQTLPFDSLAVLPFENAGADPDAEYFSDGITESIIQSVSEFPNLRVMARSTVFRFKGHASDPLTVARQLNVRAVLTGRVLQRGDSLIIGTELVDVMDGSRLWGKSYQRPFREIFAIQEEIAREISDNLRLKLTVREKKRLAKRAGEDREAYQLYLRGRFFWNKRTEESIRKGIEYFRQAVELDPTYALAYAGLAESYMPLGYWGYVSPADAFPNVKAWALKALELDDQLAEAHTPLGAALIIFERDMESSQRALRRAIELNPNYPRAHQVYAEVLSWLGEFDAAADEIRKALVLDPLSAILHVVDALITYFARRYEEVIPKCRRSLEIEPTFAVAYYMLGLVSEELGKFENAVEYLQESLEQAPKSLMIRAELGRAYALWGKEAEAREILEELLRIDGERYVSAYWIAIIYAGLRDRDQVLMWLIRANEERSTGTLWLNVTPAFDAFRSDPQFKDLARIAGLPARGTGIIGR
jgi:TolB-like protein/Tfp pilus assembly protein PilF